MENRRRWRRNGRYQPVGRDLKGRVRYPQRTASGHKLLKEPSRLERTNRLRKIFWKRNFCTLILRSTRFFNSGTILTPAARCGQRPLSRTAPDPGPILHALAQSAPNWIHQNIADLRVELMGVPQTMIEKILLPRNARGSSEIFFPIRNRRLHPGVAGKNDDRVQMIWHQQNQATMPNEPFMVIARG